MSSVEADGALIPFEAGSAGDHPLGYSPSGDWIPPETPLMDLRVVGLAVCHVRCVDGADRVVVSLAEPAGIVGHWSLRDGGVTPGDFGLAARPRLGAARSTVLQLVEESVGDAVIVCHRPELVLAPLVIGDAKLRWPRPVVDLESCARWLYPSWGVSWQDVCLLTQVETDDRSEAVGGRAWAALRAWRAMVPLLDRRGIRMWDQMWRITVPADGAPWSARIGMIADGVISGP